MSASILFFANCEVLESLLRRWSSVLFCLSIKMPSFRYSGYRVCIEFCRLQLIVANAWTLFGCKRLWFALLLIQLEDVKKFGHFSFIMPTLYCVFAMLKKTIGTFDPLWTLLLRVSAPFFPHQANAMFWALSSYARILCCVKQINCKLLSASVLLSWQGTNREVWYTVFTQQHFVVMNKSK